MAVKIIITRKVPQGKEEALLPLLKKLRALATAQPGYITGETLRNAARPEEYVVLSTWRSVDDWDGWVDSDQRKKIQEQIDEVTGQKTTYGIYLYG